MSLLLSLLQAAVKRPSKLLFRDYLEIRYLQNSKDRERFVKSALERTKRQIAELLEENDVALVSSFEGQGEKACCMLNPIEGIDNFARALPFFCIVLVAKAEEGESVCLLNFPALQKSIYASSSAWINDPLSQPEEQRLRSPKGVLVQTGMQTICLEKVAQLQLPSSFRALTFGSVAYSLMCFLLGSADYCIFDNVDQASYEAMKILINCYEGHLTENDFKRIMLSNRNTNLAQLIYA